MSDPIERLYDTLILQQVALQNATLEAPLEDSEAERFRRFLTWERKLEYNDSELATLVRDWLWWDSNSEEVKW